MLAFSQTLLEYLDLYGVLINLVSMGGENLCKIWTSILDPQSNPDHAFFQQNFYCYIKKDRSHRGVFI